MINRGKIVSADDARAVVNKGAEVRAAKEAQEEIRLQRDKDLWLATFEKRISAEILNSSAVGRYQTDATVPVLYQADVAKLLRDVGYALWFYNLTQDSVSIEINWTKEFGK